MKLRYNLLIKSNALWVEVFHSKYGLKEKLFNSILEANAHIYGALSLRFGHFFVKT